MTDSAQLTQVPPPAGVDRYLPLSGQNPAYPRSENLLDFVALRAMIWRQRYVVGGVIAAALVVGLLLTLLTTPMYNASASVRVAEDAAAIVEGQDLTQTYIPTNEVPRYMQTLGGVIESRSMAFKVVDTLQLYDNEDLLADMLQNGQPAGISDEAWLNSRRSAAAAMIRSSLSLDIPFDRRIIGINIAMPDPRMAALIANGYAGEFVAEDVRRGFEANSFAREFLEGEIAETRSELQAAEVQAINYARNQRIFMQPLSGGSDTETGEATPSLASSSLGMVSASHAAARARRIDAQQRWNAIANAPPLDLPEVQQNQTVQTLRTQRAQAAATLAELGERYQADHPAVREATGEIAALDAEIASTARSIKQGLRNEFTIARQQEEALQQELAGLADATLDEQDLRVQFNLLNREAEALRSQLDSLLQRFADVSAASNLQTNRVSILDEAVAPQAPFAPKPFINMIVALLLGSGLAVVLAVLRETIDDRMADYDDVERRIGLPMLGQTPFASDGPEDDLDDPFSPLSEAYSSIRATIDFTLPASSKIIQFTSTQPGEGKTTTAIAVAKRFASVGQRTLLIDLDLRRPAVGERFGKSKNGRGLIDVLHGNASLQDALFTTPETPSLSILALTTIPDNPVVVLSSGMLQEFLSQLATNYDRIVLDSSPVLGIADAPLLARYVDALVFVVEANRTHARQVKSAVKRLEAMGVEVTGAILTKYRALEAGEAYTYQYKYYSYAKS